jgi:hypothetical protein
MRCASVIRVVAGLVDPAVAGHQNGGDFSERPLPDATGPTLDDLV